jgi:hypothetical protein
MAVSNAKKVAIGKRTVTNMAVSNAKNVAIGKRTVTNTAVWIAEKVAISKRTVTNMAVWNAGFFPQFQLDPLARILSITGKGAFVLKADCSRWSIVCLQMFCYT